MQKKVLIINGPNLNLLGQRDPSIYGQQTLDNLISLCKKEAKNLNLDLEFRQSNYEGEIISWIQQAKHENFTDIVINPGAYAHTSIAIMDAVLDCTLPVIEVHLSNIYKRENFRNHSYIARAAKGVISGLGFFSYISALYVIAKS